MDTESVLDGTDGNRNPTHALYSVKELSRPPGENYHKADFSDTPSDARMQHKHHVRVSLLAALQPAKGRGPTPMHLGRRILASAARQ